MGFAQITKPGARVTNEDSVASLENDSGSLFVIADGLGGHGKGEIASKIAVDTFTDCFEDTIFDEATFMTKTIELAQSKIMQEQKVQNTPLEMKTTCAALLISNGSCQICHVGDTRVYIFQNNKVKVRTLDHSVPQMLVISGDIREKRIRNHPDRNRLLRVMGIEWYTPQYELSEVFPISECQAFLLCSDGFWELCDEKKMCATLKNSANAGEWLNLMTAVVERKGIGRDMDNYSAIAIIL